MSKRLLIGLIILVIALVLVGVWLAMMLTKPDSERSSGYSAVVLSTGDVYFGKLGWFPWPNLKKVYLLQQGMDAQNQPQVGLVPFTNAFWGPTDQIFLNPREIVFWANLKKDSQVARNLNNPQVAIPQQMPAQVQQQVPASSAQPSQ